MPSRFPLCVSPSLANPQFTLCLQIQSVVLWTFPFWGSSGPLPSRPLTTKGNWVVYLLPLSCSPQHGPSCMVVLVCSGCYHKAPQNSRNLLLTLLGAGVWDRGTSIVSSGCRLLVVWQKEGKRALWVSFIRAWIPYTRAPSLSPNYLPNGPPPNTVTLRVRISIHDFLRDTNIRSMQWPLLTLTTIVVILWKGEMESES